MKEMKDLQKLIEERANDRLYKDVDELKNNLRKQKLLMDLPEALHPRFPTTVDPAKTERKEWYYLIDGSFERNLRAYWLPKYIEQESAEFLKKVDSLQREVDELYNATQTYKP